MSVPKKLIDEISALPASARSELVNILLESLDTPDKEIDEVWKKEAEDRVDGYEKGNAKVYKIEEILAKYK